MVALDLETTGTNKHTDRIVTAAVVAITPRPSQRPDIAPHEWLADPGVPIPEATTKIHGITTEQARREGRPPADVLAEIDVLLQQVWTATTPLCVFNASYDLTLLDMEMRRHLARGLTLSGPVIDPILIDWHLDPSYWKGKSKLHALCAHHRVRLDRDGVHTALADALAAARLAWRLANTHPHIGQADLGELHRQQVGWYRDRSLAAAKRFESEGKRASAAAARAETEWWPICPERRSGAARPGEPARARASWTRDEEETLRQEWLAADPQQDASAVRALLAQRHGRTPVAIRGRLLKLRCDPELTGQTCDEQRAEELRRRYDDEFGR